MKYTYNENKNEFCELRDRITKEGISIYYDTFDCGSCFFSIRISLLDGKYYLVKRCNKRCIEIYDLSEGANNSFLDAVDRKENKTVPFVEKKNGDIIFEDEE